MNAPSQPSDTSASAQGAPAMSRLGEAAAIALPAAAVCALPAGVRAALVGAPLVDVLLVACAASLLVLWPLLLLRPAAVRGWRALGGGTLSPALAAAVGVWTLLSVAWWVLLGAALAAVTHHRALGGVTFGVFAVTGAGGAVLIARRLTGAIGRLTRPVARGGAVAIAVWLAVASLLAAAAWGGGGGGASAAVRAASFDAAVWLVVGVTALTVRRWHCALVRWRSAALAASLALLVAAGARVELSGGAAAAAGRAAGLAAAMLRGLEMWSDRDGDGYGAHFGGGDCDEGDAQRHPGAVDRPGDGVDADCDGRDGQPAGAARSATAASRAPAPAAPTTHPSAGAALATGKPDIILVTLDTVRADHTSAYGYDKPTTPALRRLAARGTLFEHAYATGSNTQRALMPIFSGRTLADSDASRERWPRLRAAADTVAERLAAVGYRTAAVSSFTWLRKDLGFAQGFERFDETPFRDAHPERMSTGELAARRAIAAYRDLAAEQAPLLLWLHLFDAHAKYLEHPGGGFGKGARARYDGEIAFADAQLGKLLAAVEGGARAGRTVWVVHGTQGEAFGEHDASGHGGTLAYDEVLRVPLVVVAPRRPAQRYGRDAVSMLDVAPTVLAFAGADDKGVQGRSLEPIVAGALDTEHPPVLAYATHRTVVIDWPLKLVVKRRRGKRDRRLLFDLVADPGERHDLTAERRADVERLNAQRH